MIRRWLDDRRYRRRHKRLARDDGFRLFRLVDTWPPPFIGYRPWCDGRRKDCECGERCCDCAHTERSPDGR